MAERRMTDDASKHRNTLEPPRAEVRRSTHSAHGLAWDDDYAWIRAENWREVLRDPSRLPADIRALLEAENAYADALLAPTAGLQKELVREMRARLKEDDSEPPQVDGPWAYYSRYRHGGQHRIYCRRPRGGGEEMVLIDGDERAEGAAFFHLASVAHLPDHAKLALLDAVRIFEVVRCVELVIAEEFPSCSVELVRARLDRRIENSGA